jgi:hypothetical protein
MSIFFFPGLMKYFNIFVLIIVKIKIRHFEQLKLKSFDDNTFVLEPFNPKQIALILRRFEILYVERRFFNRNNNNAG